VADADHDHVDSLHGGLDHPRGNPPRPHLRAPAAYDKASCQASRILGELGLLVVWAIVFGVLTATWYMTRPRGQ
jgi:hypothetical protein